MLIGGITHNSLRVTALALRVGTVEEFLEKMRHIATGISDGERKHTPNQAKSGNSNKGKEMVCRNCGKAGHDHKECRGSVTCFYCKTKGHMQFDCPNMKKKDEREKQPSRVQVTQAAASIAVEEGDSVAAVQEVVAIAEAGTREMTIDNPLITISEICGQPCELSTLIDTGSPVSFIKCSVFEKIVKPFRADLKPVNRILTNLSSEPLNILGVVKVKIILSPLKDNVFEIDLFVLDNTAVEADLILGREFLHGEGLTLVYRPRDVTRNESTCFLICL